MSVTVPVGFTVDFSDSVYIGKVKLSLIVGVILLKLPEFTVSTISASEFGYENSTDELMLLCPYRYDFVLTYVGLDSHGVIQFAQDGKETSSLDLVSGEGKTCLIADYQAQVSLSMIDDFSIVFGSYFSINISASTASISYSYGNDTKNCYPLHFICNGTDVAISDFVGLADCAEDSLYYIGDLDLLEREDATELVCRKECRILVLNRVKYLKSLVVGQYVEDIVTTGGSTFANLNKLYISKDVSKKVLVKILHNLIASFYREDAEPYDVSYLNGLISKGNYDMYWSYLSDKSAWKSIDMDYVLGRVEVIVY